MSQTKYRAQILLEPNQHQALAAIAAERQESISHVVREIVQEYLIEYDQEAQLRQELQAIAVLTQLRQTIQSEKGLLPEDLLTEARAARAAELGESWEAAK